MNNDLYIVINKTKKKINSSKQTNKVLEDKNIFITQVGTIYDFNNKQLELIDIKYLYNKYKCIRIGVSDLPLKDHYRFGILIKYKKV